jgi:hypothetical protein
LKQVFDEDLAIVLLATVWAPRGSGNVNENIIAVKANMNLIVSPGKSALPCS